MTATSEELLDPEVQRRIVLQAAADLQKPLPEPAEPGGFTCSCAGCSPWPRAVARPKRSDT